MSETIIHATASMLVTFGLMAINCGCVAIGYAMFASGLFWLTYRESES